MKSVSSSLALVVALAALAISTYTHINPPLWKHDIGQSKPGDVVYHVQSLLTDGAQIDAIQAFRSKYRKEIMRGLEVVDVSESGEHGVVFFRYSIGTDIFREAYWTGKVDGKWYWLPNMEYSDDKPVDEEWFEKMMEKKERWEEESANLKFL